MDHPHDSAPGDQRRPASGFTLVELLVSMTILSLLILMVGQLTSTTGATVTLARKRQDADGAARMVFDRMAQDFARMLRRADVDGEFTRATGSGGNAGANDRMAFLAEGRGYYSGGSSPAANERSPVVVAGFRVRSAPATAATGNRPVCQLERLAKGLGRDPRPPAWFDVPHLPVTLAVGDAARWPLVFDEARPDPDFQLFSDAVFRLEFYYLLRDGTFSLRPVTAPAGRTHNLGATAPPTPDNDRTAGYAAGSRWYDANRQKAYVCTGAEAGAAVWRNAFFQDVASICVTLGVLDPTSRVLVTDYAPLIAALPDASEGGAGDIRQHELGHHWSRIVNRQDPQAAFPPAGIPAATAAAVRVYQRTFDLDSSSP